MCIYFSRFSPRNEISGALNIYCIDYIVGIPLDKFTICGEEEIIDEVLLCKCCTIEHLISWRMKILTVNKSVVSSTIFNLCEGVNIYTCLKYILSYQIYRPLESRNSHGP